MIHVFKLKVKTANFTVLLIMSQRSHAKGRLGWTVPAPDP